jgi:hypothetical protein
MMEAVRTSEMLVNFYQTTRRYNPEDSHLQTLYCLSYHGSGFRIEHTISLKWSISTLGACFEENLPNL